MAVTQDQILALEEALAAFGYPVVADGQPGELRALALDFMNRADLALGGPGVTLDDYNDSAERQAALSRIQTNLSQLMTHPRTEFMRDVIDGTADRNTISDFLSDEINLPPRIASRLATQLDNMGALDALELFVARAQNFPQVNQLLSIGGANATTNIANILQQLDNANSWVDVIDAVEDAASGPLTLNPPNTPLQQPQQQQPPQPVVPVVQMSAADAMRAVELNLGILVPALNAHLDRQYDALYDTQQEYLAEIGDRDNLVDGVLLLAKGSPYGLPSFADFMQANNLDTASDIRSDMRAIIPLPEDLTIDDGLNTDEQIAIQGSMVVLAEMVGISMPEPRWAYSPQAADRIFAAYKNLQPELRDDLAAQGITEDVLTTFFNGLRVLDSQDILAAQEIYNANNVTAGVFLQQILGEHLTAKPAAQIGFFDAILKQYAGGLGLRNLLDPECFDALPRFPESDDLAAAFVAAYNSSGASDIAAFEALLTPEDLELMAYVPYGSEARHEEFVAAMRDAFTAARAKQDEDATTDITILAAEFARLLSTRVDALNADPATRPDRIVFTDLPLRNDPRLHDFEMVSGGASVNADPIFQLYAAKNAHEPYQAYHKAVVLVDDEGQYYVAAVDRMTRIFTVQPIDLDAIEAKLAETEGLDHASRKAMLRDMDPGFRLLFAKDSAGYLKSYEQAPGILRRSAVSFPEAQAGVAAQLQARQDYLTQVASRPYEMTRANIVRDAPIPEVEPFDCPQQLKARAREVGEEQFKEYRSAYFNAVGAAMPDDQDHESDGGFRRNADDITVAAGIENASPGLNVTIRLTS